MSDGIEVVYSSWYNEEVAALPEDQRTRIEQRIRAMIGKGWNRAMHTAPSPRCGKASTKCGCWGPAPRTGCSSLSFLAGRRGSWC